MAPRNSFLALPSLGGKLTIVNANFWIIALLISRSGVISAETPAAIVFTFVGLSFFFALPFALCLMMPGLGPPSFLEIVGNVLLLILNSFAWGYGLAWCLHSVKRHFKK